MIINNITESIGDYLRRKRINLTELSQKTGIHYSTLYASVWDQYDQSLLLRMYILSAKPEGV